MELFLKLFAYFYLIVGLAVPVALILIAWASNDQAFNTLPLSRVLYRTALWALFWPIILVFED